MTTENREKVLELLADHKEEIRRMGVKSLAVFGSVSRGEATETSDVDVLVDFEDPATYDGYMKVKGFLEELLGINVDLVTHKALKDRVRQQVEGEAVYVT